MHAPSPTVKSSKRKFVLSGPARLVSACAPSGGDPTIAALAWQYAPDTWATLIGAGSTAATAAFTIADEVKVAERFTVA